MQLVYGYEETTNASFNKIVHFLRNNRLVNHVLLALFPNLHIYFDFWFQGKYANAELVEPPKEIVKTKTYNNDPQQSFGSNIVSNYEVLHFVIT